MQSDAVDRWLAALEARHLLDSTIAHELVHILTAQALAGRPRWVIEGAATFFSSAVRQGSGLASGMRSNPVTAPESGRRRTDRGESCPLDGEFRHPVSRDSLRDAYARAAACVTRRIEAGTSWRDLK